MAGNISDDGSAPVDFNLSSTIEDENKTSSMRKKCMLCCNLRKTFYCNVCIRNGDFVSSTPQHPGTKFSFYPLFHFESYYNKVELKNLNTLILIYKLFKAKC